MIRCALQKYLRNPRVIGWIRKSGFWCPSKHCKILPSHFGVSTPGLTSFSDPVSDFFRLLTRKCYNFFHWACLSGIVSHVAYSFVPSKWQLLSRSCQIGTTLKHLCHRYWSQNVQHHSITSHKNSGRSKGEVVFREWLFTTYAPKTEINLRN